MSNDNSGKERSEKGQFWKEGIRKRTILKTNHLKKNSSEKENLNNDNAGREHSEKGQFITGTIWNLPILNRKNLKQDSFENEKSRKEQF